MKLLPWFTPPIAFYQKWWAGAGRPNSTLRAPASFISRESFPFPICGARVSGGVGVSGVVERVTAATRAAFPTRRRASPVAPPRGAARASPTSGAGRLLLTRRRQFLLVLRARARKCIDFLLFYYYYYYYFIILRLYNVNPNLQIYHSCTFILHSFRKSLSSVFFTAFPR